MCAHLLPRGCSDRAPVQKQQKNKKVYPYSSVCIQLHPFILVYSCFATLDVSKLNVFIGEEGEWDIRGKGICNTDKCGKRDREKDRRRVGRVGP